jgi:hypothetical protein
MVDSESVEQGVWKHEIFACREIDEVLNEETLEAIFGHLNDLGKTKNKRIYIGPGRDGSSDDKIAVDCKFGAHNTTVPYNKSWGNLDYRKTTFKFDEHTEEWTMIEDQKFLRSSIYFAPEERPDRIAIFIHPPYEPTTPRALVAVDPEYDFEQKKLLCVRCCSRRDAALDYGTAGTAQLSLQ